GPVRVGQLAVGLGPGLGVVLGLGQLVQHAEVVQPAAQVLDPAQVALHRGQPAGHPLGRLRVVPQVRPAGLLLQVGRLPAKLVQVEHRLDGGHRGGQLLERGRKIDGHVLRGYASASGQSAGRLSRHLRNARSYATAKSAAAMANGSPSFLAALAVARYPASLASCSARASSTSRRSCTLLCRAPKPSRSSTGLRGWSAPGGWDSQLVNARRPAAVTAYGWDARGPTLPGRTYPALASTGSSRYTWLRVRLQNAPNRSSAAATSSPPVIGPSCSRPS